MIMVTINKRKDKVKVIQDDDVYEWKIENKDEEIKAIKVNPKRKHNALVFT